MDPAHTPFEQNTGLAALSYLGLLLIIPLFAAKDDPFVYYHLKQGIVLMLFFIVGAIISMIPILGWLLGFVLNLVGLILAAVGITNARAGRVRSLPLIGSFADLLGL